jgi:hypothetical protein
MKASELIRKLQLVMEACGDLPVYRITGEEDEIQELEPPRLFIVGDLVLWSADVEDETRIIVI